ncbi:unnamed protein product, partial [Heterosigma akashiwo]
MESVRIIPISDGSVPKTHILYGYVTAEDQWPLEYIPIVFDNYSQPVSIDGEQINLSIWDTAGQEEYDRLRTLSYPGTDVFMFCFSVVKPDSFDNLRDKWLPEIRQHCPEAILMLVGCKNDLRFTLFNKFQNQERKFVTSDEGEYMAAVLGAHGYFEVPSFHHSKVAPIFHEGAREALRRRR